MLWYLATNYSLHKDGLDAAYRMACEQAAVLIKAGVSVFSPIAATHGIAIHGGIEPLGVEFWMSVDTPFIERCDGLVVLMSEGWALSQGVRIEREAFQAAGKPIVWMTPGVVPKELLRS